MCSGEQCNRWGSKTKIHCKDKAGQGCFAMIVFSPVYIRRCPIIRVLILTAPTDRHMTASSSSNCNPQTGCAQQTGKRVSKGEEGVSLFAAACKYGTMRLYSAQNFISGFHTTFYACVTYFEQNGNQAIFPSSCNLMTLLDYDGFPSCWVCVYHHRQNWTQRLQ